jgi:hypothetical protein
MQNLLLAAFLACATLAAQSEAPKMIDQNLLREVDAIRDEIDKSLSALRAYTWVEHTEVFVKKDSHSKSAVTCLYGVNGALIKRPLADATDVKEGNSVSKRPVERKRADLEDYIGRAVTMIGKYFPPNPQTIDHCLRSGQAEMAQSKPGEFEIRLKEYYQPGDTMVFSYDPSTKALRKVTVASTLGSKDDPVTLEALFEPLPEGINHLASSKLVAKNRKIEVHTTNTLYKKRTD